MFDQTPVISRKVSVVVNVPVFSLDGPVYESSSSPYLSDEVMIIKSWSITAGASDTTAAATNTTFCLMVGDNTMQINGSIRSTLVLPKYQRFATADLQTSALLLSRPGELVVTRNQWIRVDCTVAGSHESVTVKIVAEVE
jgi:hypothetical protein